MVVPVVEREGTLSADWSFSGQVEMIVWAIPFLTIMLLGGVAWISSHQLDPANALAGEDRSDTLEIEVVSLDWKWLFIYPREGIASVNRLVIPVGVPIRFSLTSASVMNAFFIPRLGSMIYTMNGMETHLNLRADEAGRYAGLSSHFSGDGFSDMHFDVDAVPSDEFSSWAAQTKAGNTKLDEQSYRDLTEQTIPQTPFTYSAVDPLLFGKITGQNLPPVKVPGTRKA